MRFSALAEAFRQIAATTSRRLLTALLAELFRSDREDADILPYLLQGQLGPPYAAPDLGLDEQRIALAIAAAANVSIDEVASLDRQWGDLGLVAEHLLAPAEQPATVREVYDQLHRIALTVGVGAYTEKVALFQGLLRRTGGHGALALVRIALGRLRLGVGDATLLDALSMAIAGHTELRQRLGRAYALCSDLGLVAGRLLANGPAALDEIHPTPGRPILPALAERLPSPEEIVRRLGRVFAEPKYDGLRLQVHKDGERIWLFSRRLENLTESFPEIRRAAREHVLAHQAILDGEAVGYDPRSGQFLPFQQTMRRHRKHRVTEMEGRFPLRYYAFDLLSLDGQDLTSAPLRERSARLREIIRAEPNGTLATTLQIETADPREIQSFVDEMLHRGLEGAVVKRPDAPYDAGARQYNWIKLKREYRTGLADTFDLVVIGYDRGRGKRARLGIGSLLCAAYDAERDRFCALTRVGSGLADDEWLHLRELLDAVRATVQPPRVESPIVPDVWTEPRYVVEVVAGQIVRSPRYTCGATGGEQGFALRFPRVASVRFDRRAEDATTAREVAEIYRLQRQSPP